MRGSNRALDDGVGVVDSLLVECRSSRRVLEFAGYEGGNVFGVGDCTVLSDGKLTPNVHRTRVFQRGSSACGIADVAYATIALQPKDLSRIGRRSHAN